MFAKIRDFKKTLAKRRLLQRRVLNRQTADKKICKTYLNVRLQPSASLAAFILGSHLLAIVAIVKTSLPWFACVMATLLLGIHCYFTLKPHWYSRGRRLCYDSGHWYYYEKGANYEKGAKVALSPIGECVLWPWLVVLNFKTPTGERLSLVLPNDAADAQDLRRLRVLLGRL